MGDVAGQVEQQVVEVADVGVVPHTDRAWPGRSPPRVLQEPAQLPIDGGVAQARPDLIDQTPLPLTRHAVLPTYSHPTFRQVGLSHLTSVYFRSVIKTNTNLC